MPHPVGGAMGVALCTAVKIKRDKPASYWGERSEPHTCGENGKLSIYIYIYV